MFANNFERSASDKLTLSMIYLISNIKETPIKNFKKACF